MAAHSRGLRVEVVGRNRKQLEAVGSWGWEDLPSGYVKIAIENGHLIRGFFPLKMVIFHSYVSLPEGNGISSEFLSGFIRSHEKYDGIPWELPKVITFSAPSSVEGWEA